MTLRSRRSAGRQTSRRSRSHPARDAHVRAVGHRRRACASGPLTYDPL